MSVLVAAPVKNASKWLSRFLDGIMKIDYPGLHFAFLEGDSSDNTYEVLSKFKRAHRNVWLQKLSFKEKNRFKKLAKLRNTLIDEALQGEDFVFMVDADIIRIPRDIIRRLISAQVDAIAPLVIIEATHQFYDTHAFMYYNTHFGWKPPYCPMIEEGKIFEVDSVGSCYLVNRKVYDAGTRYGTHPSEQRSFFREAKKKGFRVWAHPKLIVRHARLPDYGENWH